MYNDCKVMEAYGIEPFFLKWAPWQQDLTSVLYTFQIKHFCNICSKGLFVELPVV